MAMRRGFNIPNQTSSCEWKYMTFKSESVECIEKLMFILPFCLIIKTICILNAFYTAKHEKKTEKSGYRSTHCHKKLCVIAMLFGS